MKPSTVLHYSDSSSFGGAERAIQQLISGLDRQRWRTLLAYHDADGIRPLIDAIQSVCTLQQIAPMPEGARGLRRVPALVRQLRTIRPDVFHAHLTWQHSCKYGLLAAALARVPVVVATVQLLVDLPVTWAEQAKSSLLSRGVHRYLAVSQATARRLRTEMGIAASRIRVVPNAVPAHQANQAQARLLRTHLAQGRPLVLALARLVAQKGLDTLIEAAALVPEATFAIAGEGPLRPALEAQIARLGIGARVQLLGFRSETAELLEACDLLVLPSQYEGLPLALLEAMAAAKPVIASAIGGNDEAVVHGTTGILVPPGDVPKLARAIRALLAAPAMQQWMGVAAIQRFTHSFSQQAMVAEVAAHYEELLAACPRYS